MLTKNPERWSSIIKMQSLNPPNDDNIIIKEGGDMQYDKEFKLQALELSDEIGVKAAAEQLGIKYYTLADWRRQRKARGEEAFVGSGNKMMPLSEKDRRIKELEEELRETKRANDILKEALGFFAQSRKK